MKSAKNSLFIFLALYAVVSCSQPQSSETLEILSVQEFEEQMEKNKNAIILDVRTPEEFSEGHIAGAINKDYFNENFQNELDKLDKGRTYLIYCKSGMRQEKTGARMKEIGFEKIYLLDGGITGWQENNKPIEK